jgi:PAS domain S-box-containing protein
MLLCLLILTSPALYAGQIELTDKTHKIQVNPHTRILEDPKNTLTIHDILTQSIQHQFLQPPKGNTLNLGYTSSAYWIELKLKYTGKETFSEWWYQLDLPLLDESELYIVTDKGVNDSKIISKQLNYDTPISEREIPHVTQVYAVTLKKGDNVRLYLKVKSDYSIHLPLIIYTPEGFSGSSVIEESLYGAFIGSILILIAYNFFMFISVKETTFLYYIIYMSIYLTFLLTERVHGLTLFGDIPDLFHKENLTFYFWISWFFALMLARSFLETKENEPDLDAIIKLFISITLVSILVTPGLERTIRIQVAVFATIPYAILMVWISWIVIKRGNPVALFYFTAWFLNFSSVIVYALTITGFFPLNFMTSNSPHFGIICQMVIISFALADRIKIAQKKAARANKRSLDHLRRYRSLFDNAVEGIFQISLNRRFIDANPAMAEMLGYQSPESLVNNVQDALRLCYPKEEDFKSVLRKIERGQDISEIEARYIDQHGETRWATSTLRIIYRNDDSASHLEGTFVDITERVEREKARIEKDVAEASATAKSRFLANMSHEIRTPLTAIIGYGESLLDDTLSDEEKRESSEVVVRSGKHLLALVNDILDHSKIDAEKMKTEIITIDLLEIFKEIKNYFQPKAENKHITFTIQYEFPLPEQIQTDPTRLKQILINLCGNALKFTEKGGITINVRCDRSEELLIVQVIDTGIGVKEEQLDKLFDPFAQASPATARQYGGTGLGLSISRQLAEILGGSITANSTYGEGSEFEVHVATGSLDHTRMIRNHSDVAAQRLHPKQTQVPHLKGRVLYAEDNEVNCKLVTLLIKKTGASIITVPNGAKALEIVTRHDEHFDLILMDIQMPVMDGRDATVAIRAAGINTPIIAMTANVMEQDVAEYKQAGCTEFMPKPIQKQPFYDMLCRYLEVLPDETNNAQLLVPPKPSASSPPTLQGTVLIAEDNEVNRRLASRYIKRTGVEILTADNGQSAVDLAMQTPVDLILMDHHMPIMEGPEAIENLRKQGFNGPILAFTASDDKTDHSVMLNAGCDGIVDKPIKKESLYQTLSKYLVPSLSNQESHPWLDQEIRPIATSFIEEIPSVITTMKEALLRKDFDTLKDKAHQVKGSASSLGFPNLTHCAEQLENIIKHNKRRAIKGKVNAFVKEARLAQKQFKKHPNSTADNFH